MAEKAKDLVRPDSKINERVMRYFIPPLRLDLIMMFINIGCLFLGSLVLFIFYTLSPEVSEVLEVAAYLLILAPVAYYSIRCVQIWSYSDFALPIVTVIGFLFNTCLTLLSYMDSLILYNRLVNRRYLVAEGVVIFKEKTSFHAGWHYWFNRMVVVKSSTGYIRTVEYLLHRQYKQCSLASSVLMVVPDPLKSQIDSSIRIAAEPFRTKE